MTEPTPDAIPMTFEEWEETKDCTGLRRDAWNAATAAAAVEKATLEAEIERLREYAVHNDDCQRVLVLLNPVASVAPDCDCGLTALLTKEE